MPDRAASGGAAERERSVAGDLLRAALSGITPDRGCLLTFHRAAPAAIWPDLPNRGFHLDLGFLDRLLGYLLGAGWSIVTVEEALGRAAGGSGGRYVNFSVDDCYRDTFEHVVPLFRRHSVPVTLFVTTGIPDRTLPIWAAGLETILAERPCVEDEGRSYDVSTTEAKRRAFAAIAASWDGPQAAARYGRFCEANGHEPRALDERHAMTWDMLAQLRDDPLVEIGAHTVSHRRVSELSRDEAMGELAGSRARLEAQLGTQVRHFAFPYGRSGDCGPREFDLAREAGFASAATTRKGLVGSGQDAFSLPRNTLNGNHRSLALVEAHLLGLSGVAASLLGRV